MGFNKRYLPDVEILIERRNKSNSDEEFLEKLVGKSDSLIGSTESFAFIDRIKRKIDNKNSNK